jgi:hypothetical protein
VQIEGFRPGDSLDHSALAAAGLRLTDKGDDPEVEYWENPEKGLRVVFIIGLVSLVNGRGRAILSSGHDLIDLPCEAVARLISRPPDAFDKITGEWLFVCADDELAIGFSDGHVTSVTLSGSRPGMDLPSQRTIEPRS